MIRFCETHKEHVKDDAARCRGYGAVEYIDEYGMADLNRDPCNIVEYEAKNNA